jgi:hypothetical protein
VGGGQGRRPREAAAHLVWTSSGRGRRPHEVAARLPWASSAGSRVTSRGRAARGRGLQWTGDAGPRLGDRAPRRNRMPTCRVSMTSARNEMQSVDG